MRQPFEDLLPPAREVASHTCRCSDREKLPFCHGAAWREEQGSLDGSLLRQTEATTMALWARPPSLL